MNETMSLVLATAILAIGGVGFFMYKQSEDSKYLDESCDDSVSDIDSISDDDSISEDEDEDEYDDDFVDDFVDYEPKVSKQKPKTKRNKSVGGTRKKRY